GRSTRIRTSKNIFERPRHAPPSVSGSRTAVSQSLRPQPPLKQRRLAPRPPQRPRNRPPHLVLAHVAHALAHRPQELTKMRRQPPAGRQHISHHDLLFAPSHRQPSALSPRPLAPASPTAKA